MYSRDETIVAISNFYKTIVRHAYLDNSTLILPPSDGWNDISIEGKNDVVLDLLRHLPYLGPERSSDRLIIHWETIPICYTDNRDTTEPWPLPSNCVFLAHSVDREGTNVILDTDRGTVTPYCITGSDIAIPDEEYDALPYEEQWRGYRAFPIKDFFDGWTLRYASLVWMLLPNPIGQPTTGNFYTRADTRSQEMELLDNLHWTHASLRDDTDDVDCHGEHDSALDGERRLENSRRIKHVVSIYETYIRHGWPDHFNKERCRAELLALEKKKWAEDLRLMDEMNPDS